MVSLSQGRRDALLQKAFLFSFILLFLFVLSGCGGSSIGGSTPPACSDTVSCTGQSDLQIDVGNKSQMQIHDTQEIRVVLHSKSSTSISNDPIEKADIPAEQATVSTAPVIPIGTPDTSLQDTFGAEYTPYAIATLTPNSAFTIAQIGDTTKERRLDKTSILWKWLVTARPVVSTQILDVDVAVIWKPNDTKLPIKGPMSIGDLQISIQITEPIPTPTPTSTLIPTPTTVPTLGPVLTPTSVTPPSPSSGINGLQIASDVASVANVIWLIFFGSKAVFEVTENRPKLKFPSTGTITNILLAAIFLVLIWILFHPFH